MTDRKKEFMNELKSLLKKYNAEICLEDMSSGRDYYDRMEIVIDFNDDPYEQIVAGSWIDEDTFSNEKNKISVD